MRLILLLFVVTALAFPDNLKKIRPAEKTLFDSADNSSGRTALPLAIFERGCEEAYLAYNAQRRATVVQRPFLIFWKKVIHCPQLSPDTATRSIQIQIPNLSFAITVDAVLVILLLETELIDKQATNVYSHNGITYVPVNPDAYQALKEFYYSCVYEVKLMDPKSVSACADRQDELKRKYVKLSSVLLTDAGVRAEVGLTDASWTVDAKSCLVTFFISQPSAKEFELLDLRAEFGPPVQIINLIPTHVGTKDEQTRAETNLGNRGIAGISTDAHFNLDFGLWTLEGEAANREGYLGVLLKFKEGAKQTDSFKVTYGFALAITKPHGSREQPDVLQSSPVEIDKVCEKAPEPQSTAPRGSAQAQH